MRGVYLVREAFVIHSLISSNLSTTIKTADRKPQTLQSLMARVITAGGMLWPRICTRQSMLRA
jgi:hypothetical protein